MKTRVFWALFALLCSLALFIHVHSAHAQNQGNRRLGNVVITNNATTAGECPITTSANLGTWQSCSGGGGGANDWCNGSSAVIPYGSLVACGSTPCEQWASALPGGSCLVGHPIALGTGGGSVPVNVQNITVAEAFPGASTPTVHGVSSNNNSSASATFNAPTNSNGDCLTWITNNAFSAITALSGWTQVGGVQHGNQWMTVFNKVASSEPGSYTAPGSPSNLSQVMYALSGTSACTTPDAIQFGGNGAGSTTLVTAALSGLSTAHDLWIGGFGSAGSSVLTMTGTPTTDVWINAFASGNGLGLLAAHLALTTTSDAGETVDSSNGGIGGVTCKIACTQYPDSSSTYVEEGF